MLLRNQSIVMKSAAVALFMASWAAALAQSGQVIKDVIIEGNKNISKDAILASMRSTKGKPCLAADLAKDEASIRDMGFFQDVKVFSRALADNTCEVKVELLENPLVKEIRISGNTVFKTEEILKWVTQQTGQVLNLRNYQPTADRITQEYTKKGYLAVPDIGPLEDSPNTLNITVNEQTIGDIIITGTTRTNKNVIKRMLRTKPGKAFNTEMWAGDYRKLNDTRWFKSINATPQQTGEIGKMNILLDVVEDKTSIINFAAVLDPRSNLAGSVRYSDINFKGSGQVLSLMAQQETSGSGTSASIDFNNPYMDDRNSSMQASIYTRVNNYFTGGGFGNNDSPDSQRFDERRTGVKYSIGKVKNDTIQFNYGIGYEGIKTINLRNVGTTDFIQQDGTLLSLSASVARDTRDNPFDPYTGDFSRLTLEPGFANITKIGGNVGGNTEILGKNNFLRTTFEYKKFLSKRPKSPEAFADPRPVLAFRTKLGMISGKTPFFEQLFLGGSDSLRGYSDQRFWGKTSFLSSLEYRMPIITEKSKDGRPRSNLKIIGFLDYGGAWGGYGSLNNFEQSTKAKMQLGYGIGLGFNAGQLGPIRVDIGFDNRGKNRTHFSIGGSF